MTRPLYIIYSDNAGVEDTIFFDIVQEITHVKESEASMFPIENGSAITDHVVELPLRLSFSAMTSNSPLVHNPGEFGLVETKSLNYPNISPKSIPLTPLEYPSSSAPLPRSPVAALGRAFDSLMGNTYQQQPAQRTGNMSAPGDYDKPNAFGFWYNEDVKTRAQNMFNKLNEIRVNKFFCEIVTDAFVYTDMLIVGITSPISHDTGNAMIFNIDAQQVKRITNRTVEVPVPAELLARQQKPKGNKNTKPNNKEESEIDKALKTEAVEFVEYFGWNVRNR